MIVGIVGLKQITKYLNKRISGSDKCKNIKQGNMIKGVINIYYLIIFKSCIIVMI